MYWAHSDPERRAPDAPGAQWQPLAEHLRNVSKLASELARAAAPQDSHFQELAAWGGLLHDYGKYTAGFQKMILEGRGKCPHAAHGAALALSGATHSGLSGRAAHVASAIAGHHAGMPDLNELREKLKKYLPDALALLEQAASDLPELGQFLRGPQPQLEKRGARFDLLTRMLLSCLVDADRLDTAGRSNQAEPLAAANRLQVLRAHIEGLAGTGPENAVGKARREVLDDCLRAASLPESLFSLSVPTGGGKTLSAMAFALKRAALQPERYRRIIVVIPYLSIIEQNAEVYAKIFGQNAILEHHSGSFVKLKQKDRDHFAIARQQEEAAEFELPGRRPETENWDAPFIVTTSVRFFESLFSNHPSDLRRVHNIARSIVILDEVQVLPRLVLAPLLAMIEELCRDWGCSFLLSTATRPAFERAAGASSKDLRWEAGTVKEIVADPPALHHRLRRVAIDWRIKEAVDWTQVSGWMREQRQALCVVNLREHAAQLYDELQRQGEPDGLFHLSTRMCAAHRLAVIGQIRQRLREHLRCLVVSTQLIEAGVDLDFPVAFRALGPLDSIVQVAGRADREGKLTAAQGKPGGLLVVFKPLDHRLPPNEYENATGLTETLALYKDVQGDDLDTMAQFFEAYYGGGDLGVKLVGMRARWEFKTLADNFEMISSRTQDVYVPYGAGQALINQLMQQRLLDAKLRRALQRYTVGLQPWEFREAQKSVLFELTKASNVWIASELAYRNTGLQMSMDSSAAFG